MTTQNSDNSARDYRETLFLPKTDFPMRAGLPKREPEWIKRWEDMNLYKRLRDDSKGREKYVLHDGPPYANGHIHMGTAMNKILKDLVVRAHQMMGYDSPYVPGWDCHGLPIEWKVEEEFRGKGRSKDDVPPSEFRTRCREYAAHWLDIQREEFKRLGVVGDWDNPYKTMDFESEAVICGELLKIAKSGQLYRGSKPVMWSPVEQTALAEAEVEYEERRATNIYVKFPVQGEDFSVLIWTTTPWTIPANRAVSYSKDIAYGLYEVTDMPTEEELGFAPWAAAGDTFVLADALADKIKSDAKIKAWERRADADPSAFICSHPLKTMDGHEGKFDFDVPMLAGDHVTDDAGTGFVHTAPSHGDDDYNVWLANGLSKADIPLTLDDSGCYTDVMPTRLQGLDVIRTTGGKKKIGQDGKANGEVIKALMETGNILSRGITMLRDAHSWRSKAPVLRRATPQWFISMSSHGLRDKALEAIGETEWVPTRGENRIRAMVQDRPDWLISRQRAWGVPITLLVENGTGRLHTELPDADAINERILNEVKTHGVDGWFDASASDLLGDAANAKDWTKVTDILDVWFDSGSTHAFVVEPREVLGDTPVSVYLEGSDQHRGWFQSSLMESCATRGRAPYKSVVTHGFVVDETGKKMSKSLGNTLSPIDEAKSKGAEILRLWVAASDYQDDLRIGEEIIQSSVDAYRKLRNTVRYMLGALNGFSEDEKVSYAEMPSLERWVLHRLSDLDDLVRDAYAAHDFKRVYAALFNFCTVDLSSIYFDIRKDALYCDPLSSARRRACRTVMDILFDTLTAWLAPIMVFTMEEAFLERYPDGESVHLKTFPEIPENWRDPQVADKWETIRRLRAVVTGALEVERREKRIGSSLEAAPKVYVSSSAYAKALAGEDLADICITSQAALVQTEAPASAFTLDGVDDVAVVPGKAEGVKCARSWKYFDPASADPAYPDVTPRDARALKEWDAAHG